MPLKKAAVAFEDTLKRQDFGNERWVNAPDEDQSNMNVIEGRLLIPPEMTNKAAVRESDHEGLAAAVGWTRPVSLEVSSSVRGSGPDYSQGMLGKALEQSADIDSGGSSRNR